MKKRLIALIMALCVGSTFFLSCGKKKENAKRNVGDVAVWTATGVEKIMQEENYSERFDEKTLTMSAFRNEYEAGQIVITADSKKKADIQSYDVQVSDLKTADGEVLPKTSWSVFNEKYTHVTKVLSTDIDMHPAWYPDALLPFETAVEYGENSITWKENQDHANQAIWLQVKPSKEQAAGIYTGSFTVTVDGNTFAVPVSLRVYDYTLGDYTHTKSSYAVGLQRVALAELDASREMFDSYYDALLDRRINPQNLIVNDGNMETNISDSAVMETFLQEAVKAATDPRWTSFNLPYMKNNIYVYTVKEDNKLIKLFTVDESKQNITFEMGDEPVTEEEKEYAISNGMTRLIGSVDFDLYKTTLKNIALRGLQESLKNVDNAEITEPVDIMKKAETYFMFNDEYDAAGAFEQASYNQEMAWVSNQEAAAELETLLTCSEEEQAKFETKYGISFAEYKATVIDECKNLKNKLVGSLVDQMIAEHGTMVPEISKINTTDSKQNVIDYQNNAYGEENSELWVYTCCFPRPPFSTFHVDDYLISARLYGWLMYEYNAVGHLYWTTTLYAKRYEGASQTDNILLDYYYDPLHFPSANGDGSLFYPGREYGIFGPISSIRLEALRDGIEEYDLLYELEEIYRQRGVTGEQFDNVYKKLHEKMHNEWKIVYGDSLIADFYSNRDTLAVLLENAYSDNGVIIEDYVVEQGMGKAVLSAKEGVNLTCNAQTATGETFTDSNGEKFVRYAFDVSLLEDVNYVDVVAEKAGVTTELKLNVGGRSQAIEGSSLKEVASFNSNTSGTVTNDGVIEREIDGVSVQDKVTTVAFNGTAKDADKQTVAFDVRAFTFNSATRKIVFGIYYDADEPLTLSINYNTNQKQMFIQLSKVTLQTGWNEIELPVSNINYKGAEDFIKSLTFNVQTTSAVTLHFGSISVEG